MPNILICKKEQLFFPV